MKPKYIREKRIFYKRPLLTRIWDKYNLLILLVSMFLMIISKIWANGFRVVI